MKNLLAAICILSAVPAMVEFVNVTNKLCDQKKVTVQNGERIFIDLKQSVLGVGFTDAQNCRVVDFKSVVIQATSQTEIKLVAVSSVGRRSSCASGILNYEGPQYTSAIVRLKAVELRGLKGECSTVTFEF